MSQGSTDADACMGTQAIPSTSKDAEVNFIIPFMKPLLQFSQSGQRDSSQP
jgi:hypothetical protein